MVLVEGEERKRLEFNKDEIEPWDEMEALRRKAEAPCDKHENGECDCNETCRAAAGRIARNLTSYSTGEEDHDDRFLR